MNERNTILPRARLRLVCGGAAVALLAAACGGGAKQADSPGACPDGTILKGADCVPPPAGGDTTSSDDEDKAPSSGESHASRAAAETPAAPPSSGTPYDKDAVEAELKRAARQIKANCGAATDDDGNATGPWGKVTVNVTLGRNGHVKQVTVPPEYDGKPAGKCIGDAFRKIWFPPYAGSDDVAVDREVNLVKPKR